METNLHCVVQLEYLSKIIRTIELYTAHTIIGQYVRAQGYCYYKESRALQVT